MNELTNQQKLFVNEYIKSLDAEKSLKIAGYKSECKEKILSRLLSNPKVIKEIKNELKHQIDVLNVPKGYVIQKVLLFAQDDKKLIFFNYIIQASNKLHTLPFGQKIISKLLMNYPKLSMYLNEKKK